MSIREFVLPVEWTEYFEDGDDADTVSFGEDSLFAFLDTLEDQGLTFVSCDHDRRQTYTHDTPFYGGDELQCFTYTFREKLGNSPWKGKRKVNIGQTKAPLPKDITT